MQERLQLPIVSVYMTVKNGMPFIKDSIASIIDQSFENWEAVIVDDGSTDETIDYLESIASKEGRIKLIKTGGVGRGAALNIALRNCSGEFMANLDADDIAHPQRIEIQLEFFNMNEGVDFLCADVDVISESFDYKKEPIAVSDISMALECINESLARKSEINHSTVIFRKRIVDLFLYSEERKAQIDYELWYRLALKQISLFKIPVALVAKRVHAGQSYESGQRLSYLFSALLLKISYLNQKKGVSIKDYVVAILLFLYGMLPVTLRMRLRSAIN